MVKTSQTIASKIQSMLEDDGIAFPVEAVDYKSIQNELLTAGIYVYQESSLLNYLMRAW
ncbi:hypothetical protein EfmAA96_10470 [Enterococcus faecium]|nr:hypothetical protein EfmAA96_10470 [Enterococcus faecium]